MQTTIKGITDGLQKIASLSVDSVKSSIEAASKNMTEVNKVMSGLGLGNFTLPFGKSDDCDCCPPKEKCPPHCILHITRHASAGEKIIVPFLVKNKCGGAKRYRIGVRELKNIDGSKALSQPQLNKNNVTLDPGESELVKMEIDLNNFSNGTYNAEIVLREKDINQNICFKLVVDDNAAPVAEPLEEKKYLLHWQSWRSHFYCETPKKVGRTNQLEDSNVVVSHG
jgi:hypothetical protein